MLVRAFLVDFASFSSPSLTSSPSATEREDLGLAHFQEEHAAPAPSAPVLGAPSTAEYDEIPAEESGSEAEEQEAAPSTNAVSGELIAAAGELLGHEAVQRFMQERTPESLTTLLDAFASKVRACLRARARACACVHPEL